MPKFYAECVCLSVCMVCMCTHTHTSKRTNFCPVFGIKYEITSVWEVMLCSEDSPTPAICTEHNFVTLMTDTADSF